VTSGLWRLAGLCSAALVLAACNPDSSVGYVEIKTVPATATTALYLDATKLEPFRNGNAVLKQKVGTIKLQAEGDNGNPALLCNVVVQKNRITSVTISVVRMTAAPLNAHFIVGMTNSAPSFTPEGQREVTVLVLV
jgi:hypothetical protein